MRFKKIIVLVIPFILSCWCYGLQADLNHDGRVDLLDLSILSEEWLMKELGTEIINNGSFSGVVTEWTVGGTGIGWDFTEGVARFTDPGGVGDPKQPVAVGSLGQSFTPLSVSRVYRIQFSITTTSDYALDVYLGTAKIGSFGNGSHQIDQVIDGVYPADGILFDGLCTLDGGAVFNVDDVSIREISTGSDLVSNGDFSSAENWIYGSDWVIYSTESPFSAQWNSSEDTNENRLSQSIAVEAGKTYVVAVYPIINESDGSELLITISGIELCRLNSTHPSFYYFKALDSSAELVLTATGELVDVFFVHIYESNLELNSKKQRIILIDQTVRGEVVIRRQGSLR